MEKTERYTTDKISTVGHGKGEAIARGALLLEGRMMTLITKKIDIKNQQDELPVGIRIVMGLRIEEQYIFAGVEPGMGRVF